jgi:hypothetical protein
VCRMPGARRRGKALELVSDRSSRYTGYAPLALTLALILATPLPWKRRTAAACWGALLATLFVVFVPAVQAYPLYLRKEHHLVFNSIPSLFPPWQTFVYTLSKITRWATFYYIAPFLIWITVAVRREELRATIERLAASTKLKATSSD